MSRSIRKLAPERREVWLAFNPKAGAGGRQAIMDQLCEALTRAGYVVQLETDLVKIAHGVSESEQAGRLRCIVAAGGDGTLRTLAQALPPRIPLALFPLGTENLLANFLGQTANIPDLLHILDQGCCVELDAGVANGQLFTLMAGIGFDADVVRRLHQERTGNIGHLSYLKPIFESIRTYDYPPLEVECFDLEPPDAAHVDRQPKQAAPSGVDSEQARHSTRKLTARWVFVVNVPRYAGGLSIAPDADPWDGWLDVCTFRDGSLWNGLLYLGGVLLGQQQAMEGFQMVRAKRIRISAASCVPMQLDGDPGGELPVEIAIAPRRIAVLVTAGWAHRQGFTTAETESQD